MVDPSEHSVLLAQAQSFSSYLNNAVLSSLVDSRLTAIVVLVDLSRPFPSFQFFFRHSTFEVGRSKFEVHSSLFTFHFSLARRSMFIVSSHLSQLPPEAHIEANIVCVGLVAVRRTLGIADTVPCQ